MLIELLRPAGPELARRWLAALLLAPDHEREAIVASVERRMAELYSAPDDAPMVSIRSEPRQRDGYTEEIIRSYSRPAESPAPRKARAKRSAS